MFCYILFVAIVACSKSVYIASIYAVALCILFNSSFCLITTSHSRSSLACTSIRSRIFYERWSFVLYVFVTLCLVFSYVLSHPIYSYFCLNTTITLERKSWPCLCCSLFGLLLCAYLLTYLLTCYFARIFTLLFRSTERPLSLLYSLIIDLK